MPASHPVPALHNKPNGKLADTLGEAILGLVVKIPTTREAALPDPLRAHNRAHAIAHAAARKASLLASAMALPPGVLGWVTLLPELMAVWKLQSQMVADIAGVYGQQGNLTREHLLYCLFKQVSAQLMRDVVVQAGERLMVRKASSALLQNLAHKLGLQVSQKLLGKSLSRFVPLVGAVGVGAYAYYDTTQVGKTAMALFSGDITPSA